MDVVKFSRVDASITEKAERVRQLNDLWLKMRSIIDERSIDPAMQDVPGGTTGLLMAQTREVGPHQVTEYVFDVVLMREIRATLRQISMELGQWGKPLDALDTGERLSVDVVDAFLVDSETHEASLDHKVKAWLEDSEHSATTLAA